MSSSPVLLRSFDPAARPEDQALAAAEEQGLKDEGHFRTTTIERFNVMETAEVRVPVSSSATHALPPKTIMIEPLTRLAEWPLRAGGRGCSSFTATGCHVIEFRSSETLPRDTRHT